MPLSQSRFPGDAQRFLYDQPEAGEQRGRGGGVPASWGGSWCSLEQPCLLLSSFVCQTFVCWARRLCQRHGGIWGSGMDMVGLPRRCLLPGCRAAPQLSMHAFHQLCWVSHD